jgi:hypothetical protein
MASPNPTRRQTYIGNNKQKTQGKLQWFLPIQGYNISSVQGWTQHTAQTQVSQVCVFGFNFSFRWGF